MSSSAATSEKRLVPLELQRGWQVLVACVLGSACGVMAITFYTQSLYIGPVTEAFGWGRGQFLASYTILMLFGALVVPMVGSLIEKFGPVRIAVFSLVGHALGYCLLAVTSGSLVVWYLSFAFLAVVAAGTLPVTWMFVIHKWFYEHRGKAIGFTMAGTGMVAFIAPPLVEVAIASYGWRAAYAITGLVPLAISLPVVLAFLRLPDTKTEISSKTAAIATALPEPLWGYTRKEAVRQYRFWALGIALALMGLAVAGLLPNFVSILTDKGMARDQAAGIAAVIGLAVLAGRVIAGFMMDRFWAPAVASVFIAMPVLSMLVFLFLPVSGPTAVIAAATLGLALGAEVDMLAYMTGRYFGAKHFAPVFGIILAFFMFAAGVAPAVYGIVFDKTGSYEIILSASIMMLVVCMGLFLSFGKYPNFHAPREAR